MKQISAYIALLLTACCVTACFKDKGNYTYHPVNEVAITDIDTTNGYVAYYGQTFSVTPVVKGSLDKGDAAYRYEWSYENSAKAIAVLATTKDLNVKIDLPPGNYTLFYRVTDVASGVQYRVGAPLLISSEVYEGYLVLNDVNGKSRLDMLSYKKENADFTQYTDVLARVGSTLPQQGKPYKVFCMHASSATSTDPKVFRIYIATATGTSILDSETFGYTATGNIRYEMVGDVPQQFTAENFFGIYQGNTLPTMYMYGDNGVYIRRNNYMVFPYVKLNTYAGEINPYKISPYIAASSSFVMMFNTDKRVFTRTQSTSSITSYDIPASQDYPTGKDLVHMEAAYTGNVYAIMKNPANSQFSIIRFTVGAAVTSNDVITATDIDKATRFAVSPDRGYLFYSVGGKVYEYDLSLKTSKLMLDKGPDEVTYLAFPGFFFRGLNTKYAEWSQWLTVGTYPAAGGSGTEGTLEQYYVPPVNGALESRKKWTGFGKIVSIAYRERR